MIRRVEMDNETESLSRHCSKYDPYSVTELNAMRKVSLVLFIFTFCFGVFELILSAWLAW